MIDSIRDFGWVRTELFYDDQTSSCWRLGREEDWGKGKLGWENIGERVMFGA